MRLVQFLPKSNIPNYINELCKGRVSYGFWFGNNWFGIGTSLGVGIGGFGLLLLTLVLPTNPVHFSCICMFPFVMAQASAPFLGLVSNICLSVGQAYTIRKCAWHPKFRAAESSDFLGV